MRKVGLEDEVGGFEVDGRPGNCEPAVGILVEVCRIVCRMLKGENKKVEEVVQ